MEVLLYCNIFVLFLCLRKYNSVVLWQYNSVVLQQYNEKQLSQKERYTMTEETIEYLHKKGSMPDWAYYQQNGKSPEENYREQRENIIDKYHLSGQLEKIIEKKLNLTIENALNSIFKDFKF